MYCALDLRVRVECHELKVLADKGKEVWYGRGVPLWHFIVTNQAMTCLASAIAMDEDALADWLGQRVIEYIGTEGDCLIEREGWTETPFEAS